MEKNSIIESDLQILKVQNKPTDTWQTYLDEDDDLGTFYTQEGVNAVSNALDKFIYTIMEGNNYIDPKFIENTVQETIEELNEISNKFQSMIETEEREDLLDFIYAALDTIGYDYNGDITEKWRKW